MDKKNETLDCALRRSISAKIVNLLQTLNLSIEEAALNAGLEYSNFYYVMKGKNTPRLDTLLKIARSLNVPPEYFFKDVKVRTNSRRDSLLQKNTLLNKIIKETNKLEKPAQTFFLKVLKIYNGR
ncbi:MAG: helix-turn-helix domain-containing protein [Candidatus Margulisbacteria bacterium]|jgi:transcriptional regulator with XRE-family HTH domain|nr:helix-turn-helix domain-containing protein [Candidatus Margulisiibacteriota bacterium]